MLGSVGIYAWQDFEHQSKPSTGADVFQTESEAIRASPTDETSYCTNAQHEKDRVTMAFAFGSGVLQKLPDEEGLGVSVNEGYWARMSYRSKVGFMRSLECAIAGPGKALANTDVRSQKSNALLAKWQLGKLNAP
jgi:hypothetical protein